MSADALTPPAEPSPSKIKSMLPFVLALVLGLGVGGASGAFVVGPAMAKGITPSGAAGASSADIAPPAGGTPAGEGSGEGKPSESAQQVYTLDNLVLNPAESGGTRFLLLSVAFETSDATLVEEMKTRDAELRDAVLVTLGAKTVDQLADMRTRESIKSELNVAARKLFKKRSSLRVYFPQFVIQ